MSDCEAYVAHPHGKVSLWLVCTVHGPLVALGVAPPVEVVAQAAGAHAAQVDAAPAETAQPFFGSERHQRAVEALARSEARRFDPDRADWGKP